MYTSLDHLSKEEVIRIKERYYQGESVYKLMEEYDLRVLPSTFYKLLPPDLVQDYGCSKCNANLVIDAVPRSKQRQDKYPQQYYCPICGRRPFKEKSGWVAFPSLSEKERKQKQQRIEEYYEKNLVPVEYDALSLTQKVYLAVLCKSLLRKDRETIKPLCETELTLAATPELQEKIYKELIKAGIIIVSAESRMDAFDINSKIFPKKYDREKVSYKLNLMHMENGFGDIRKLLSINCDNNDPEIIQLWKEIAIGECIVYLKYRLEKVGFQFQAGNKTKAVFQKLLKNFSVSQIYYIIWCKVSDASRWYLEGGVSRQRVANSVIAACERYGENALYYKRELPQYHKPSDCPRSVLTRYFYFDVLKLGYQADYICPDEFK